MLVSTLHLYPPHLVTDSSFPLGPTPHNHPESRQWEELILSPDCEVGLEPGLDNQRPVL